MVSLDGAVIYFIPVLIKESGELLLYITGIIDCMIFTECRKLGLFILQMLVHMFT